VSGNAALRSRVTDTSISYVSSLDATPEGELSALVGVYRLVLDCHAEKKAAPDRRPDDVERRSDEIDATASTQRTA
jgi:hypothetical protein